MRIIFILSGLLISVTLLGQDWIPILESEEHHFELNSEIYTIRIDSSMMISGQFTSYLNGVVGLCDSCLSQDTILDNQPQFLMKKMVLSGMEPGVYYFRDSLEYVLCSFAQLGGSWVFNSEDEIMAVVDDIYDTTIFGVEDEIKKIELSNGRVIKLSKYHGIIQFPDFNSESNYLLAGLQNSNKGYHVPDFYDFYDFEIGDVFEYENNHFGTEGERDYYIKRTILSKFETEDTLRYDVHELRKEVIWNAVAPGDTNCFEETKSLEFFRYDRNIADGYLFHSVRLYEGVNRYNIINYEYSDDHSIRSKVFYDIGPGNFFFPPNRRKLYLDFPSHPDVMYLGDGQEFRRYEPGLGQTDREHLLGECDVFEKLIGYVKAGDTTGIVHDDEYFLPVGITNYSERNLNLWPVPAFDMVYIDLGFLTQDALIEIIDLQGKIVSFTKVTIMQDNFPLNISHLNTGIYFCRILSGNQYYRTKLVIK